MESANVNALKVHSEEVAKEWSLLKLVLVESYLCEYEKKVTWIFNQQCGIKMQVQRQQVYRQEKSGLDQPRLNNHKTQTGIFFPCNLLAEFSLSGA